ncbi:MAG: hypothetical protein AAGJ87_15350 [Pseudomonadota bacterium]
MTQKANQIRFLYAPGKVYLGTAFFSVLAIMLVASMSTRIIASEMSFANWFLHLPATGFVLILAAFMVAFSNEMARSAVLIDDDGVFDPMRTKRKIPWAVVGRVTESRFWNRFYYHRVIHLELDGLAENKIPLSFSYMLAKGKRAVSNGDQVVLVATYLSADFDEFARAMRDAATRNDVAYIASAV